MNNRYPVEWGRNLEPNQIKFVQDQIDKGTWKVQKVPKELSGLKRDHFILRAKRSGNNIKFSFHGDQDTFCPPRWADLGIGSGACGFGCRSCFLMLTFRIMRDPFMPVIYNNDFRPSVKKFLSKLAYPCQFGKKSKKELPATSLGLGIDCSDSLLYESVTNHARSLIPLFSDPKINKFNKKLVLLTKSVNTHFLKGYPTENIIVTFSLNPEPVADSWEGKYPDNGERITPSINDRLKASLLAQDMGFEVRWRIDPILPIENWVEHYEDFFRIVSNDYHMPKTITLGTYREKSNQLDTWRKKWDLLPMETEILPLEQSGTHWHLTTKNRIHIYSEISQIIIKNKVKNGFSPSISLCKETKDVRLGSNLNNNNCNCLDFHLRPKKREIVQEILI